MRMQWILAALVLRLTSSKNSQLDRKRSLRDSPMIAKIEPNLTKSQRRTCKNQKRSMQKCYVAMQTKKYEIPCKKQVLKTEKHANSEIQDSTCNAIFSTLSFAICTLCHLYKWPLSRERERSRWRLYKLRDTAFSSPCLGGVNCLANCRLRMAASAWPFPSLDSNVTMSWSSVIGGQVEKKQDIHAKYMQSKICNNTKKPSAATSFVSGHRSRWQLGIVRGNLLREEDWQNPGLQRVMHPEIYFKSKSTLIVQSRYHLGQLHSQAHTNQLTQPKLRASVQ